MSYLAVLISLDVGIVDALASGDGVFSGMFECPLSGSHPRINAMRFFIRIKRGSDG